MRCPHSDYGYCRYCVVTLKTELELSLARNTKLQETVETLERQNESLVEELNAIEEDKYDNDFGSGWSGLDNRR